MHVKLEVETAPLSVFTAKLKKAAKIFAFFSGLIVMNSLLSLGILFWIPSKVSVRVQHQEGFLVYLWALVAIIWLGSFLSIYQWWSESRDEARWRSSC